MFQAKGKGRIGIAAVLVFMLVLSCMPGFAALGGSEADVLAEEIYANDFENFSPEKVTAGKKTQLELVDLDGGKDVWNAINDIEGSIKQEKEPENQYFELSEGQLYKTISFGNAVEICARMKMEKEEEGTNGEASFVLRNTSNGTGLCLGKLKTGKTSCAIGYLANGNLNPNIEGNYTFAERYDYGQWIDMKFVIKNLDSADGNVKIDVYRDKGSGMTQVIADGVCISSTGIKGPNLAAPAASVRGYTRLSLTAENNAGYAPGFDDISVVRIDEEFALANCTVEDGQSYDPETLKTIDLTFNYPVDSESKIVLGSYAVSAGDIQWYANGSTKTAKALITLPRDPGGTCILDLSGVKDIYGRALPEADQQITFTLSEKIAIDEQLYNASEDVPVEVLTPGEVTAKVTFRKDAEIPAVVVVAVYNGQLLTDVSVTSVESAAAVTSDPVTVGADTTEVRVFVWNSTNGLSPLRSDKSFK